MHNFRNLTPARATPQPRQVHAGQMMMHPYMMSHSPHFMQPHHMPPSSTRLRHKVHVKVTKIHSRRMRTARLLWMSVFWCILLGEGCILPAGGIHLQPRWMHPLNATQMDALPSHLDAPPSRCTPVDVAQMDTSP